MVKEVVCKIVADISKNTSTVGSSSSIPVVEEDAVGNLPERSGQCSEECRRHDKTVLVHGEVMVDTVENKVKRNSDTVIGQIIVKVEQNAVQDIFDNGPDEDTKHPIGSSVELVVIALGSYVGAVCDTRQPDRGNHPPSGLGERLKKVSKQRRRLAALVVARAMDLVQIELFGESSEPKLGEERFAQVEKLVLLVIQVVVCVLAHILRTRHSGSRMNCAIGINIGVSVGQLRMAIAVDMSIDSLFRNEKSDDALVEDFVRRVRVCVRIRIFEDRFDIAAGPVEDVFGTAGMVLDKVGDIVDLVANSNIARIPRVVRFDLCAGEGWKSSSRHLDGSDGRN